MKRERGSVACNFQLNGTTMVIIMKLVSTKDLGSKENHAKP